MLIFIDGASGTTGLQLEERLSKIPEIELIKTEDSLRKDSNARKECFNRADAVFLCLPDDAAIEAVKLCENPKTVIIDASTAHRIAPGWAYGFPELSRAHHLAVKNSNRIAVPGCHASGFCALIYPLVAAGLINETDTLFCNSLTGYSGGGKTMISDYETGGSHAARAYALTLSHKHLPEMTYVCGLKNAPVFQPVVVNARQGMITSVPLTLRAESVWEALSAHYVNAENISVAPLNSCDALVLEDAAGTDNMEIFVFGNEKQTVISARFDNLGKGSSGAAVQCLKLRMGI